MSIRWSRPRCVSAEGDTPSAWALMGEVVVESAVELCVVSAMSAVPPPIPHPLVAGWPSATVGLDGAYLWRALTPRAAPGRMLMERCRSRAGPPSAAAPPA